MELEGKVAIVTGALRGIGRAIAEELAAQGASVVINYTPTKLPRPRLSPQSKHGAASALAVQADVSDFAAAEGLVKTAADTFGPVDILVNNAGTTRDN